MTPIEDLRDKVAIVTGATKGMGRSTAILLARSGAKVIATGRSEEAGAETAEMMRAAGGEGLFMRQDVTVESDWEKVCEAALSQFGGLDILDRKSVV